MKKKTLLVTAAAAALMLSTSFSFAEWKGYRGSGGWGMGGQYQRNYNAATVETLSGTVESVEKITPMKGMQGGVHILLKTEKESISVHLGPSWFIARLDTRIDKGDPIEVKGSRIEVNGSPALIAAEVRKGDHTIVLRDSSGIPVWSGWKRQQ